MLYFDKIYYVNLDCDTKKNVFFIQQINKTIFKDKCERFVGVDGKTIDINTIDDSIITNDGRKSITSQKQKIYGVSLTYGSLGCALSHKKIWEECSQAKNPYLIFEDDIIPHKNFNNIFNKLYTILPNLSYDIFYIGYNEIPGFRKVTIDDVIAKPSGLITGTYGYIVTPSGAQKLLSVFPLNKQIDSSISANLNKFKVYCSNTKLVSASSSFGSKTQRSDSCKNNIQCVAYDNWNNLFKTV
jgi:GR25 family glycosyltransferase involved in LPS biosynthesis